VDKSSFSIPKDYQKLNFTELRKRLTAPHNPAPDKGIH